MRDALAIAYLVGCLLAVACICLVTWVSCASKLTHRAERRDRKAFALAAEGEAPILNVMIEDYLALGGSEADHAMMLKAWMLLGAEYMARATGRAFTLDSLDNTRRFIRDAEPARPWKP